MIPDRRRMLRKSIARLRATSDQTIELRAIGVPARYGRPRTMSGWFDDHEKLIAAAEKLEDRRAAGIYVTLNVVDPLLLGRAHNRLDEHPRAATSDADIIRRVWLPFDFDPVRPSGISASPGEVARAKDTALLAAQWLRHELAHEPTIWAFSGNGYHLLYRTDVRNDDRSTGLVRGVIAATADRFSDEFVSVDRTVFNPGRIWKLYGTIARKGDEVPSQGRIHRRACILGKEFADD